MSQQELVEVQDWIKRESLTSSITKLPGDASTRMYFRVHANDGETYIVMKMESFKELEKNLPFVIIQKHLKKMGVDVPEILDVDADRGFLLLEDLGDVTLLRKLQDVTDTQIERKLYEKVIDELVKMQVFASPAYSKANIDAFKMSFDFEKLFWEVNFTFEHFYDLHLKRQIPAKDKKIMIDQFSKICKTLANEPTVFTHRDFHCRNIMVTGPVKDERLVMIDFQDARMGPAQYDLASLLKDSYYQLEEKQIQRLLSYYMDSFEDASNKKINREWFIKIFDLMAVQRNFKAIGSFASFSNRRGNPTYLKYIGNTFENIRRNLLKYPEYSNLREVLFHYYYF